MPSHPSDPGHVRNLSRRRLPGRVGAAAGTPERHDAEGFDDRAFRALLLAPLGPGGDRRRRGAQGVGPGRLDQPRAVRVSSRKPSRRSNARQPSSSAQA